MSKFDQLPVIEPPAWWTKGRAAWDALMEQLWDEAAPELRQLPGWRRTMFGAAVMALNFQAEREALAISILAEGQP